MKRSSTRTVILAALLAAFTTVATMIIKFPTPTLGYIHLGDGLVLLCGVLLGPGLGAAAAGIGSMLADLFSGYAHYAPGTFLIKLCMAVAAALIFRFLRNRPASKLLLAQGASGLVAEAVMVAGYFGYSCLWLGKGLAAAASIPGNVVQGALGLVTATAIYVLLNRSSALARI